MAHESGTDLRRNRSLGQQRCNSGRRPIARKRQHVIGQTFRPCRGAKQLSRGWFPARRRRASIGPRTDCPPQSFGTQSPAARYRCSCRKLEALGSAPIFDARLFTNTGEPGYYFLPVRIRSVAVDPGVKHSPLQDTLCSIFSFLILFASFRIFFISL